MLTQQFNVPAENLTSQGYGEQYLKEQTDGPSAINRRVTIRNITPLLNGGQASLPPPPPGTAPPRLSETSSQMKMAGSNPGHFLFASLRDRQARDAYRRSKASRQQSSLPYAVGIASLAMTVPTPARSALVLVALELEDLRAFAAR